MAEEGRAEQEEGEAEEEEEKEEKECLGDSPWRSLQECSSLPLPSSLPPPPAAPGDQGGRDGGAVGLVPGGRLPEGVLGHDAPRVCS